MATEHRQIHFSIHETIRALIGFNAKNPIYPEATIVGIRINEVDEVVSAVVALSPSAGGETFDAQIPSATLATALINFCIEQGIPLPRAAKKRLVRSADAVALHMDLIGAATLITDVTDIEAFAKLAGARPWRH